MIKQIFRHIVFLLKRFGGYDLYQNSYILNKYRDFKKYYYKKSKRFLFEVQLADHCNLNCVSCSHFSPIADKNFLDVTNYEKDCERFAELTKKYVYKIHLMGGEPLLHDNIIKIIQITRKNFQKCTIKIVTNGILLDRMEAEFWQLCKKNKVIISITYYPISINIKNISELSSRYGVEIESFRSDLNLNFRKDILDIKGTQNYKKTFERCSPVCHHLYEGKLYMCRVPAYIKYVNKYFSQNFIVSPDDYIDIYQVKDIKAILKYLKNPIPFCRYCNKNTSSTIEWCLSKKDFSEWL